MAKVEYVDFYENDKEAVINTIKAKGFDQIKGKKVDVPQKYIQFGVNESSLIKNLPTIFLMRKGTKGDTGVRNVIGIDVGTPLDQLSFTTVGNGRVYKHSNLPGFKEDPLRVSKENPSKLFYKVCFYSLDELSRLLDELIAVYRKN